VDQNQPTCGGAREGGNRKGAAEAPLASRWVRAVVQGCTGYGPKDGGVVQGRTGYGPEDGIFSITAGSSMQAMIRSAPPQAGQVSSGTSCTRPLRGSVSLCKSAVLPICHRLPPCTRPLRGSVSLCKSAVLPICHRLPPCTRPLRGSLRLCKSALLPICRCRYRTRV